MTETIDIAIFARAPVPGTAKTRLIPRLGAEGAAELHAALVRKALQIALGSSLGPVTLWCTPDPYHPFFAGLQREFGVGLCTQPEGDLGDRMLAAFQAHAPKPLLLIGTDCPVLSPDDLRRAAADLIEGADAVFLPAEDGGYALVGLKRPIADIFHAMSWGDDTVMSETRKRLSLLGAKWTEPAVVWDVDRPEDVDRLWASGLLPAPNQPQPQS